MRAHLGQANGPRFAQTTGGQWMGHGGDWHHGNRGVGAAIGFGAGVAIGSALAAPYYGYGPYYPGPYYSGAYYPAPYYPGPGPYAAAPAYSGAGEGDAGYCAQRFRSYDPSSGTYLGYDGQRHPCP